MVVSFFCKRKHIATVTNSLRLFKDSSHVIDFKLLNKQGPYDFLLGGGQLFDHCAATPQSCSERLRSSWRETSREKEFGARRCRGLSGERSVSSQTALGKSVKARAIGFIRQAGIPQGLIRSVSMWVTTIPPHHQEISHICEV